MTDPTLATRRAFSCPDCGDAFGQLQEDLSMVCAAKIEGWQGTTGSFRPITSAGCGLRLYLCPAHGLRTRREGDTKCRCGQVATPVELRRAA